MLIAMKKVTEIFKNKQKTLSLELFPPKTTQGYEKLLHTIALLADLRPDFISCTYGAGGGSREKTLDIVEHIEKAHQISSVAHLTCVLNTKDEIKNTLESIKARGVRNVLALRGDPPQDNPDWQPGKDNFQYAYELCSFIRKNYKEDFSVGVAGFPEGHISCPDRALDAKYLKMKIDSGADYVITQLFFDTQDYFAYVERLRKIGITSRIIPGIIPITDYNGILRFCKTCGATMPKSVASLFAPIADDKEKVLKQGIDFCVAQCRTLLEKGAPGIHFYSLNKIEPLKTILSQIKDLL